MMSFVDLFRLLGIIFLLLLPLVLLMRRPRGRRAGRRALREGGLQAADAGVKARDPGSPRGAGSGRRRPRTRGKARTTP